MIKFNDTNILVGYIKQLLHSFNLPKYKVYTKEQEKFHQDYLNYYKKDSLKLQEELDELEKELADLIQAEATAKEIEAMRRKIDKTKNLLIPEKNVLVSSYRQKIATYDGDKDGEANLYPQHMRYIPYIKDNKIQIYSPTIYIEKVESAEADDTITTTIYSDNDWKPYHGAFESPHEKLHGKQERFMPVGYTYNLKIKNGTKNLVISNNIYDSYTHEYLGDFLRFHRDYYNIDLMPLYNCFSNKACPNLDIMLKITEDELDKETGKVINAGYTAVFNTRNTDYKIYMVPIKFFQKYTIAIDCNEPLEIFCGLYGQYQYDSSYDVIMKDTYYCFNTSNFNQPQLFDPTEKLLPYLDPNHALEVAQHEDDLKLFIKVPSTNKSAIVILEGDYRDSQMPNMTSSYNFWQNNPKIKRNEKNLNLKTEILTNEIGIDDTAHTLFVNKFGGAIGNIARVAPANGVNSIELDDTELFIAQRDLDNFEITQKEDIKLPPQITFNKSVLNFAGDLSDLKLITPLQLLYINPGETYPFADRLIEYLVGNAITPLDTLGDNVKRVKTTVVRQAGSKSGIIADGLWDDNLRLYLYNYIMKVGEDSNKLPHDVLGYVDRFTETNYAYVEKIITDSNGKPKKITKSIAGVNIYGDKEWED